MSASDRLAAFSQLSLRNIVAYFLVKMLAQNLKGRADMKKYGNLIFGIIGWLVAVIMFFPIFWMAITAFKPTGRLFP